MPCYVTAGSLAWAYEDYQCAPRPNILVFMTDQETALPPGPVSTPNRRLVEERGVRFGNAFCNTPHCSPARSALLTRTEPHQTGVPTNGKEVAHDHDGPGDRLGLNGIRAGEAENQPRHGRANIPGRRTDPIRAFALRRAAL
jgi:hypothetical protein